MTSNEYYLYIYNMKGKGIFLLILLLLSVFAPLSLNIAPAKDGTYLLSLDVCNAQAAALSTSFDVPCICSSPVKVCSICFMAVLGPDTDIFYTYLLPYLTEHPPRV